MKHPIKLFELSDVVLKDDNEVGARNERRLAALIADINSSNLEVFLVYSWTVRLHYA
jgi:phenylalanyl-tRNA synthetase beta subunit